MSYLFWLGMISAFVAILEVLWPARTQKKLRQWLWSDIIYLIFNGHFLGAWIYSISFYYVTPVINTFLNQHGWVEILYFKAVYDWPMALQMLLALLVVDFLQWNIHRLLHRFEFLWDIHQVHHSVQNDEMDWIVAFRFSWLEVVIYKSLSYFPLMWFGFAAEALFFHAIFGTLIGHLNHANLKWDYGILKYLFNSPHMHLYHHAYDAPKQGQNFAIIFSCWDWIFRTAYSPSTACSKIAFPGVDTMPRDFFSQLIWPFQFKKSFTLILSLSVLYGLYFLSLPPS